MKTTEEIIEALDAIQREAEPAGTRAAVVIAMAALGAVIESDWPSPGHFELLNGKPNGTCNYRIKRAPKVRPLNAEEWKRVAGCVLLPYRLPEFFQFATVRYDCVEARRLADQRATCHPPGFPNDIRKLWVEVAA